MTKEHHEYNLLRINTLIGYRYCLFHYIHVTFNFFFFTFVKLYATFTSRITSLLNVSETLNICLCCFVIQLYSESRNVNLEGKL